MVTHIFMTAIYDYAVLKLVKSKKLKLSFRLPCLLGRYLNEEDEIEFSISCNAVNEFSVPLSPLTLLMRCHSFDEAANSSHSKRLSATDVAKRMVQFSSSDMLASYAKAKLAETRRQYLSISHRLQSLTVEFFNILLETDEAGLEKAFNISNLKAIPKSLSKTEQLLLVKRIIKAYETSLSSRKAITASDVTFNSSLSNSQSKYRDFEIPVKMSI